MGCSCFAIWWWLTRSSVTSSLHHLRCRDRTPDINSLNTVSISEPTVLPGAHSALSIVQGVKVEAIIGRWGAGNSNAIIGNGVHRRMLWCFLGARYLHVLDSLVGTPRPLTDCAVWRVVQGCELRRVRVADCSTPASRPPVRIGHQSCL